MRQPSLAAGRCKHSVSHRRLATGKDLGRILRGMIRKLATLLSILAAWSAGPVAAQSLSMIAMPAVFVSKPILQQTEVMHAGRSVVTDATSTADLAAVRPHTVRPGNLPAWEAPPFVDRRQRDYRRGLAQYGPFLVLDTRTVALIGETGIRTPAHFRSMMRDYPGLRQLDMVECPGTQDDLANMKVGRMIRAAGLVTHVPANGSVRSGAVELFLAGVERDITDGAEFAVHSWIDPYGREAADFAMDAPENRQYVEYYREMGMSERAAKAFYDFTNSVPHARALWLEANDMRRWTRPAAPIRAGRNPVHETPKLDYANVTFS